MVRKGDRPSKVPAGTFGPSTPPPPPPEAIAASLRPAPLLDPERSLQTSAAEERKRFTSTLVDGAGAVSRASVPPPLPDEARRSPSTLVGHSLAPPPTPHGSQGPGASVLSPPKWQGAKAYLEGREPKPRVSSIPNMPAVSAPVGSAHASAMPSKVTTKLGTPTAMQAAPASAPPSVGHAGDEPHAPAAPTHVAARDAFDELPVEELSPEDVTELRASDAGPVAPLGVSPSVRPDKTEAASEPMPELPVLPPLLVQPAAVRERRPTPESLPVAASARAHEPAPVTARPAAARSARARQVEPPASIASAAFASSLAPSEKSVRGDEPNMRLGVVLLAAIVLLTVGGWGLTRGGFKRGSRTAAAAAPQVATAPAVAPPAAPPPAAVPQHPELGDTSAPPQAVPALAAPASAAPPSTAAEAQPTAPTEAPAPARTAARPAVARRATPSTPTPPLQPPSSPTDTPSVAPPPVQQQPAVAPASLPPTPTREDVVSALEPLRAAVQQCAGNLRGVAQLDVTVASNGSVTHAVVAGDFAGTPEGSCIARIARAAKFSAFEQPRFRVIYPYAL